MYKIPANTLFLGKRLVFVPECHSTNTLALQLAQNPVDTDGTVVITSHQTAGRGQQGNRWESAPGMNLTFSVILKPAFLAVEDQFFLTMMTSLALHDYLTSKTDQSVYIKWPNDILVHEKKICGILIENQLQGARITSSVVGIGMNVNQVNLGSAAATSLRLITDVETDLDGALAEVLGCLEGRFLELRSQRFSHLREAYLSRLYRINEKHWFKSDGEPFLGSIRGVAPDGRLTVETTGGLQSFGLKAIRFQDR